MGRGRGGEEKAGKEGRKQAAEAEGEPGPGRGGGERQEVSARAGGDPAPARCLVGHAGAMAGGAPRGRARPDQSEGLPEAGLGGGARAALAQALPAARSESHRLEEGEISLRLARCDLLLGDLDGARRHVREATAAYRTRQAADLVREAELVRATIDVAAGHDLPAVVGAMARRVPASGPSGPATPTDRAAVRLLSLIHI